MTDINNRDMSNGNMNTGQYLISGDINSGDMNSGDVNSGDMSNRDMDILNYVQQFYVSEVKKNQISCIQKYYIQNAKLIFFCRCKILNFATTVGMVCGDTNV